jgi:hypothetical protein
MIEEDCCRKKSQATLEIRDTFSFFCNPATTVVVVEFIFCQNTSFLSHYCDIVRSLRPPLKKINVSYGSYCTSRG